MMIGSSSGRSLTTAAPFTTPKKRKVSDAANESVLSKSFDSQLDRDMKFINAEIEAVGIGFASHISGLLRDKILQNSYYIRTTTTWWSPSALGKRLPLKAYKLRHMPTQLKDRAVVAMMLGVGAGVAAERIGGNLVDMNVTIPRLEEALEWGLRMSLDCPMPQQHEGAGYENPLLAVLMARHEEVGSPLAGATMQMVRTNGFTFFNRSDKCKNAVIDTVENLTINLKLDEDTLAMADDLKIVDGHSNRASIVSEKVGLTKALFPVLKHQYPDSWVKDFEFKDDQAPYENVASCARYIHAAAKAKATIGNRKVRFHSRNRRLRRAAAAKIPQSKPKAKAKAKP